ncbi:MAG: hypothetical protein JWO70_3991, partial [Betaproteobacteria bacterium]|nr:hypothetical protein [Betaproteobacteria bacterium]
MKSAFRIAAGLLVVVLTMTGCGQLLPRNGWIPLFDGTSLDNWE